MSRLKFDAALQLHLQYGSPSAVAVSVRLSAPLAPDELAQAVQLGLHRLVGEAGQSCPVVTGARGRPPPRERALMWQRCRDA
jgi:hypothetical protein